MIFFHSFFSFDVVKAVLLLSKEKFGKGGFSTVMFGFRKIFILINAVLEMLGDGFLTFLFPFG